MKKMPTLIGCFGMVVGVLGILAGTYFLANHYLIKHSDAVTQAAKCEGTHATHTITIRKSVVTPQNTEAAFCDRLTITNTDDVVREMAFGVHDHHQAYDGVLEKPLKKDQSFSVTLNQAGTFTFHDHFHDEVDGEFTVTK